MLLSILELYRIRLFSFLVFLSKISAGNPLQFDIEGGCRSMQFQIFPLANAANGMESFLFIAFLAHRPYNVNCGVGFQTDCTRFTCFPSSHHQSLLCMLANFTLINIS